MTAAAGERMAECAKPLWPLSDVALTALLAIAVIVDLLLPLMAILAPELWFDTVHDGVHADGLHRAFLMRSAGHWLALALIQIATLASWKRAPILLVLAAGGRLSDVLTDVMYLFAAPARSTAAWLLLGSPVLNLALAAVLVAAYHSRRAVGVPPKCEPIQPPS